VSDGCLLIHKERGVSSFGVIERLQRILSARTGLKRRDLPKFGHGGTLDPFATGLLIVCMGEGTKLSRYFLGSTKEYRGVIRFGQTTIPGDPTDPVSETSAHLPASLQEIQEAANSFCADHSGQTYLQTPPMHSAKKVDGKKLYELAREGIEIERKPVECRIETFELRDYTPPTAHYRARVSAGTYIRVLGQDLGRRLGTVAMLDTLERVASGSFELSSAMTLGQIEAAEVSDFGRLECFVPLARMMSAFKKIELSELEARQLRQGLVVLVQALQARLNEQHRQDSVVVATTATGELVGVFSNESGFRLDRVFQASAAPSV